MRGTLAGIFVLALYGVLIAAVYMDNTPKEKNYIEFPSQDEIDSLEMEELLKEDL